jgi:hypothetical protein
MFDAMQNPNKNGVNVLPPSNIHVVSSKCEFLARSRSSCLVLNLSFAIILICEFLKKHIVVCNAQGKPSKELPSISTRNFWA